MGKKKGKKADSEKKAALQAKKDAKADKAARKRLAKQAQSQGNEQEQHFDLDALLQQYRDDEKVTSSFTESLEDFPPARANATLTAVADSKKKEWYLFGGEYYDGVENIVLNQLFKYDCNKQEWKHIVTPPPHPPPRCAHTTVYFNGCLLVFGGEMATADEYHHYKDVWRYDIKQQTWTELSSSHKSRAPSARSGHVAEIWKHYMLVFGGFHEALRETPIWYNDVAVLDLQTEQWMDIPHSKLATRPEPRSACNAGVVRDTLIIHGGFSKLDKKRLPTNATADIPNETKVHTDSWMLHLKPILSGKPPIWERLTSSVPRSQLPTFVQNRQAILRHPHGRSGTASVAYKDRLLVYGGVVDQEQHHHKVDSVFYNDLFCLDVERRKWFPVHVKSSAKAAGPRRQRDGNAETINDESAADHDNETEQDNQESSDLEENEEDDENEHIQEHQGWDLEKLRSNMFAFIDGSGNLIYEKIGEEEDESAEPPPSLTDTIGDDEEKEEEKSCGEAQETKEEKEQEKDIETVMPQSSKASHADQSTSRVITSSSVMTLNPETNAPEAVVRSEPLPRIKTSLILNGHTLYVYGGLLEVGDREVTLDDLWSFDLRKRNQWQCIWPGTMHQQVWRGAVHNDDDSYISSTGQSAVGELEGDTDSSDDEGESSEDERGTKTEEKSKKRSGLKQEIAELNKKYGLSDENRTPQANEALADFYSRTCAYWNEQAAARVASEGASEALSAKELKREGFALAQKRYQELEPILERLRELDDKKEGKGEMENKPRKKNESSKRSSRRDR